MHYYIDGYNLLFRKSGACTSDLKFHRESLINSLNAKISDLKLDVTVVFDSHYFPGEGSRSHYKELEILYTPLGKSADDYILDQLKASRHPQREIVVTSDKDLALKSRHCDAAAISIEDFLSWLNKRCKNKHIAKTSSNFKELRKPILEKIEKPPPLPPKTKSLPVGSQEFYLAQFEKRLLEIPPSSKPAKLKRTGKHKSKKINPTTEEKHRTEEDRWLKIFQDRLKESL